MFDILIENGKVVDGSGNPWYSADLGIQGGKIVAIGKLGREEAARRIDARGMAVAPGFIDLHTHAELEALANPAMEHYISQGVTTVVVGNCGISIFPNARECLEGWEVLTGPGPIRALSVGEGWDSLPGYAGMVQRRGTTVNLVPLVGHGNIRAQVMGPMADRKASPEELQKMKELVAEGMDQGALGLSVGLSYPWSRFADEEELIELVNVLRKYDGLFADHTRGLSRTIAQGVREAVRIGRKTGVPIQVAHLNPMGPQNWNQMDLCLEALEEGRGSDVDITCDFIPYPLFPYGFDMVMRWVAFVFSPGATDLEENYRNFKNSLRDAGFRERVKQAMYRVTAACASDYFSDFVAESVLVDTGLAEYEGEKVRDRARATGVDPWDVVFDLAIEEGVKDTAIFRSYCFTDENTLKSIRSPYAMPGSDTVCYRLNDSLFPTPSLYGSFARYYRMARGAGLSLEETVRRMSALPAGRAQLKDLGTLAEGKRADIVVFDPLKFQERATVDLPYERASGIYDVLVNGALVMDEGRLTEQRPGGVKLLR